MVKTPEEMAKEINDSIDALKSSIAGAAKAGDVEALKTQLEEIKSKGATDESVTKLSDSIEELQKRIVDFETSSNKAPITLEKAVGDFIIKNADRIKEIHKAGQGFVEFDVTKAPELITTTSGTLNTVPEVAGTQFAPLSNVNIRRPNILEMTNNLDTSLAAYAYTEALPKDGDFAFVAEGGVKPQIDFTWETSWATPVKLAAWEKITEEAVQDVKGLMSVARDYLRKKHDMKKARAILFGTGVAPENKGATLYGRAFSAGTMAGTVRFPNIMDVINAAITDIYTTHNYQDETPYEASLVMINPVDFFVQFVAAKDENGLPLYPMASLFNRVVIGGVTIVPDELIPAGKIFVADMSKYNTTNYMPYTVKIGWVNDDFIKNQFVILAESRFHAFVKKLDEQAFIYDDIATIQAAIAATT